MADQDYDDEMLRSFLECFPTYQLHSKPQSEDKLWVFSSKDDEGSQYNSYSFSDKVISAFSKLQIDDDDEYSTVQFWAPVTIGGRLLLSVSAEPFAVSDLDDDLLKYRERCVEYGYSINVNSNDVILEDMIEQDEDRLPKIISNGPPLSAFYSRLPEIVNMKTIVHHEAGPLFDYGYEECRLKFSWMIPIWDSSRSSSSSDCIGVVEFSSPWSFDIQVFNLMNEVLEEVGLRVFNVQDRIPYQTISRLKPTQEQIQKALKTICVSHNICLAQVWISYDDDKHEHFSSSLMGTQMKQMLALKLTGYISSRNEGCSDVFCLPADYYDACDKIPLKKGDELVLKTFQDYEPWFYKYNFMLGTDILLAEFTDAMAYSGLTICMRSIDTSDFDYVFEFIWLRNSDYVKFLEALLFTLKRCLPRFKCASGAELGDELHVIDVDNSTKSETKKFKIFQGNGSSPTAEAMEKGKKAMVVDYKESSPTAEAMEKGKKAMVVDYKEPFTAKRDTKEKLLSREKILQQYGKTFKEAATALGVSVSTLKRKRDQLRMGAWQGPELPQRKANNSSKNQSMRSQTNEECNDTIQEPSLVNKNENIVTIKAEYADDMKKFHLSISEATFVTVEKIISMKFKLTLRTYKLKYIDEDGDWIVLESDQDMSDCIKCSKKVDRTVVRLRVLLHDH